MTLDLRIFTEPQQGASYDTQLAVAQATERLGFSAFFRSDHYLAMGGDGLPGPTDSWTTLAGIARETTTVRLGTLVSSATFRHPGVLAIQVAQVDQMSGGRVELGLGTGWFGAEHAAYGIPFPDKRFGLLEEQLEILTGLWGTPVGETFDFSGTHYTLTDSPALPKPTQEQIPVIVGGGGPRRTPALAARFASEYNQAFPELDTIGPRIGVINQALTAAGRSPESLTQSVALVVAVGADEAEFTRRAAAIGREPAELREHGIAGTVTEAVDRLASLRDQGVERVYLQVLDQQDLDHLDLIAREVAPQL
ncbi:F420-dependent oxidoreductase-like protein [Isoptericola sp. CG 20/1183]|uniref:F420-dependent oxidoreductase-like protein n=1 Tax=Isoptericola halotolerans TaxID=300560 RepID=A0ABX5EIJ7_9MICO|nr:MULTISPECIES: LLM class F420-dependent oxidoreductase [Isoptericola]PRZ08336.1 F420-dependent oxidoreductase-like protein [Isoptericola halotolerans]PRZ09133.1 F420-dependent oxidoreductase-like protein [Isoptericola sp. CG 20/1183]